MRVAVLKGFEAPELNDDLVFIALACAADPVTDGVRFMICDSDAFLPIVVRNVLCLLMKGKIQMLVTTASVKCTNRAFSFDPDLNLRHGYKEIFSLKSVTDSHALPHPASSEGEEGRKEPLARTRLHESHDSQSGLEDIDPAHRGCNPSGEGRAAAAASDRTRLSVAIFVLRSWCWRLVHSAFCQVEFPML